MCLVSMAPPEWTDFLRVATLSFWFFTSPCRFLIDVFNTTLSASLVDRRLMFDVIRLAREAQSPAMACVILENSMDISMAFLAIPALLYPLGESFGGVYAGLPAPR